MAEQKQLYPSWSAASSVDGGDCDEEVHAASSTDKLSGDSSKVETAEVKEMLWKETRTVRRSKLVVFLALVATTIAGAVSMANVIRRGELSEFDTMVRSDSCLLHLFDCCESNRSTQGVHCISLHLNPSLRSFPVPSIREGNRSWL
jgi:hypothetical protein